MQIFLQTFFTFFAFFSCLQHLARQFRNFPRLFRCICKQFRARTYPRKTCILNNDQSKENRTRAAIHNVHNARQPRRRSFFVAPQKQGAGFCLGVSCARSHLNIRLTY